MELFDDKCNNIEKDVCINNSFVQEAKIQHLNLSCNEPDDDPLCTVLQNDNGEINHNNKENDSNTHNTVSSSIQKVSSVGIINESNFESAEDYLTKRFEAIFQMGHIDTSSGEKKRNIIWL